MTTNEDIIHEERPKGVARITINRPASYNAFRGKTVEELIHAFQRAGWDKSIGVIILTGAGDKAFCTGGDQGAHDGQYDGRGTIGLPIDEFRDRREEGSGDVVPLSALHGSTGGRDGAREYRRSARRTRRRG